MASVLCCFSSEMLGLNVTPARLLKYMLLLLLLLSVCLLPILLLLVFRCPLGDAELLRFRDPLRDAEANLSFQLFYLVVLGVP